MSVKHESFSIGPPNEAMTYISSDKKRDDLGLSLDPAEHADPKCRTCSGRGTFQVLTATDEVGVYDRTLNACGCARPRYEKRRAVILKTLAMRQARGCPCLAKCECDKKSSPSSDI